MKSKFMLSTFTAAALVALAAPAWAAFTATATTELNVRAGPGPGHQIIGVIASDDQATVLGCIEGSKWCQVAYHNVEGWAYSDYLVADASGSPVILTERRADLGVPVATYEGSAVDRAADTVVGALLAPVRVAGAVVDAVIDPPDTVTTYVVSNRIDPVYLEGEVVIGATVPDTVALHPVPQHQYRYVYINDVPVLVNDERRIVYIVRG